MQAAQTPPRDTNTSETGSTEASEAEAAVVEDVPGVVDADPAAIVERVDAWVDTAVRMVPNLVVAIVLVLLAWGVGAVAKRVVYRMSDRAERHDLGLVLGGFVKGGIILAGAALAMTVLAPSLGIGDLVASLGIGSVAIGFAFKDILQNWLAGLLILIRQPFHIGDQIVVGNHEGTVEHIETRATLIRTYDGQQIVIPNADVYTNAVTVRTERDTRRSQYDVGVGYSSDLQHTREVALEAIRGVEGVLSDPGPEALVWELAASGVSIRLRWWTKSLRSDVVHVQAAVIQAVKQAFNDAGIDIPYETQVVLFHDQTDSRDGNPAKQFEGWGLPPGAREGDITPARSRQAADPQKTSSQNKGRRTRPSEAEPTDERTTF